jgi:hypothetical protein
MGLQVIAEGIEDLDQADWLLRHGCAMAQGYAFGRPAPLPSAAEVLIDELTDAPAALDVPDAPDERLAADDLAQPPATRPTPRPVLDLEEHDDDVEPAPVAWGADPTEWDGYGPVEEPPDDFRSY